MRSDGCSASRSFNCCISLSNSASLDLGIVEHVVQVFVVANLIAQSFDLFFGILCGGHRKRLYAEGETGGAVGELASLPVLCKIDGLYCENIMPKTPKSAGAGSVDASFSAQLPAALLNAFETNDRINRYLIDNLPKDAWAGKLADGKGRTVAAIVAHMHNVRVMWLKAAKWEKIPEQLDRATVTPAEALRRVRVQPASAK